MGVNDATLSCSAYLPHLEHQSRGSTDCNNGPRTSGCTTEGSSVHGDAWEHPAREPKLSQPSRHVMAEAWSDACLVCKLALAGEVHHLRLAPELDALHEVLQHHAATGASAYSGTLLLLILPWLQAQRHDTAPCHVSFPPGHYMLARQFRCRGCTLLAALNINWPLQESEVHGRSGRTC